MSHFSVRILNNSGIPAVDVGIMIDYGIWGGWDEARTFRDGWVEFYNQNDKSGTIWVQGHNMGEHSLISGKTYSFTI